VDLHIYSIKKILNLSFDINMSNARLGIDATITFVQATTLISRPEFVKPEANPIQSPFLLYSRVVSLPFLDMNICLTSPFKIK